MFNLFYFFVLWVASFESALSFYLPDEIASIFKTLDELLVVGTFLISFSLKNKYLNKIYITILIFLVFGFICGMLSHVPINVQLEGAFLSLKGPLLFVGICNLDLKGSNLSNFFKKFEVFFYVIFVFSILDLLSFGYLKEFLHLRDVKRGSFRMLNGFFAQPSDLAEMAFVASFYFYKVKDSKFWSYIYTGIGILTLNVKEIVGFILSFFLNRKSLSLRKMLKWKRLVFIVALLVSLFFVYKNAFPDHYDVYFLQEQDGVARTVLYVTSYDIGITKFPFGEGFGRFGGYVSYKYYSPVYSDYGIDKINGFNLESDEIFIMDTFWPMIIGETGFLGLFFYILILYFIFKPFFKKTDGTASKHIVFGRFVIYFGIICSLAKPFFVSPPAYLWFFGILAALYLYDKNVKPSIDGLNESKTI